MTAGDPLGFEAERRPNVAGENRLGKGRRPGQMKVFVL